MSKGITRKMVRDRLKKFEISIDDFDKKAIIEFKESLKSLYDSRQKGKRVYKIWDIVVVVILAVLSDCNEWSEIEDFAHDRRDFLKKFLKLTGGIPSAKTYERVIGMIDSQELNTIFIEFFQKIQTPFFIFIYNITIFLNVSLS